MASPSWPAVVLAVAGIAARCILLGSEFGSVLHQRPELVSPPTSSVKAMDAVHRLSWGLQSPYEGTSSSSSCDGAYQSPLVLLLLSPLVALQGTWAATLVRLALFVGCDLITAGALFGVASYLMRSEERLAVEAALERQPHRLTGLQPLSRAGLRLGKQTPVIAAAVFLANPYSVLTSSAMSTAVFVYTATALAFWGACQGRVAVSTFWLAVAALLSPYPAVGLLAPLLLLLRRAFRHKGMQWGWPSTLLCCVVTACWFGLLAGVSYLALGSLAFLKAVYVCPLSFPDLSPNVGLYWYFFTEVFSRFRLYFNVIFIAHPMLYIIPLALRFWYRPGLLWTISVAVFALLAPYPVVGDMGFAMSCAVMHMGTVARMKLRMFWLVILSGNGLLLPVTWHVWVNTGAGNANFFYNQSLVYNVAMIVLVLGFVSISQLRCKLSKR